MKLHPFDRFLQVLLMFIVVLLGLTGIGAALGLLDQVILQGLQATFASLTSRVIAGVVCLVLIAIAVRLVAATGPRLPAPAEQTVMVKTSDNGQINITLSALDTMVQKAARGISGVRDIASSLQSGEGQAVVIALRLVLSPDAIVPETCEKVQAAVRDYVQSHAGLQVLDIPISVEKMGQGTQVSRVE